MENNSLPILPVVVVGKDRTRMTCAVIDHLKKHIKNASPYFICVSDRSRAGHDEVIKKHLQNNGEKRYQVLRTLPEENRYGWGSAINIGLACAFETCAEAGCALVVDNDWLLQKDLDIDKYLYAFAFSSIGAITFKQINAGTNINLIETSLADGSTYLRRERGATDRYSFTAEIGCMLITRPLYETYGKFTENCRTDETEWDFCNWYNRLTAEERSEKNLWFATDKDLYHEVLNGEGHVFTHVGLHSQHDGPHKWQVPEQYLYLSDDDADARICHDAYWIPAAQGEYHPDVIDTESDKIDWGKYFDKVYCACLLDERHERMHRLKDELSRVGLLSSPILEWRYGIRSNLDDPISKSEGWRVNVPAYKNYCLQYLKICKEALYLGYRRIMIIEDDIAFLKSIPKMKNILESLPDCAAIQMEKSVWTEEDKDAAAKSVKRGGFLYSKHGFRGSGCNIFSRKGLLAAIDMIEGRKWCTDYIGDYLGLECAVAIQPMAVQVYYRRSEAVGRTDIFGCHIGYMNQGIDENYSEYSVPSGYKNGKYYSEDTPCLTDNCTEDAQDIEVSWHKFFDRVYCMAQLPDIGNRMPRLREELTRVGLLSSPVFEWRFDTKTSLDTPLMNDGGWCFSNPNYKTYAVRYVKLMKEALALSLRRILVIEDDVAFLKDKREIVRILEFMPDMPIVQMDKFVWNRESAQIVKEYHDLGKDFFVSDRCFASAACNAYTQDGMRKFVETIERHKCATDQIGDHIPHDISISTKNLTVQVFYKKSESTDSLHLNEQQLHNCYRQQGIDENYSQYSVPSGYNMSTVYESPASVATEVNGIRDNHTDMHSFRGALVDLVKSIGKHDIEVLEIGSCMGDSAEVFMLSGVVRHITCVDPWKDTVSDNESNVHTDMATKEKIFDSTMARFGNKVTKFKGTFKEFIDSGYANGRQYDIVYIDAMHDYESVKQDISYAIEKMRPRMGVAGHDYYPGHKSMWGVAKAVDERFGDDKSVFMDSSWLHLFSDDENRSMGTVKKGRKFVSVYAIAKNEESVAKRWYDCVKEADEVCVLDTGSTDNTVKILRDLGAKVEVKTYDDWSFAVARNDSMKLVSPDSEILFTLDLDETIAPGWRKSLEDAWISEEEKGHKPVGMLYKYIWSFTPDGKEMQSFSVRKVHAKGTGIWKYRCHELLTDVNGFVFFNKDFVVEHHQNRGTNRSKYLDLLAKDAKEMPDDDRSAYYYARELMYEGRWHEAITEFKRHLTLPSAGWRCERASSMRNIAYCYKHLNSEAKTELWLWKSAEEDPTNREATYFLGEMAMERQDYRTAVKVFERCLAIKEPSLEYITLPIVWSARPWFLYAQALWWTGRWDEAVEATKKATEIEPKNQEVRKQYDDMVATRDKYKN